MRGSGSVASRMPSRGVGTVGIVDTASRLISPDGEWRCVVETEKGLVVGEIYFSVVSADSPVPLVEKVK